MVKVNLIASIINKFKKEKIPKEIMTANEFMNVKDIKKNILYTKDDYIFSYIKLNQMSSDLLSEKEKKIFVDNLSSELSSEQKSFKLFIISRPVDISLLIYKLSEINTMTSDKIRKKLLSEAIVNLSDLSLNGEVIERNFHIIIWEKFIEFSEEELLKRVNELRDKFERGGLSAKILEEDEIIRLCNMFTNHAYAHIEDTAYRATIPIMNK